MDTRKLIKVFGTSALALTLMTGCSTPPDPFLKTVTNAAGNTVFGAPITSTSGCIQLSGIFCQQPMYDLTFAAPAKTDEKLACGEFVDLGRALGAVAYSTNNGTGNAAKLSNDNEAAVEMCVTGLSEPLKNFDGSLIYQGLSLYDDGAKDGIGKFYSLGRGQSSPDDKKFLLTISFSKDLNRVGWIDYGDGNPRLMTQEELDAGNEINKIAAETMKTANTLLGMTEKEAIEKIEAAGYSWVIYDREGKEVFVDDGFNPQRIRLTIRDGVIYDAIAG